MAEFERYTRPDHFADWAAFDRREYFVGCVQTRDSDTLTRSNFRRALQLFGGESDTVKIVRDSHCLVGWVEAIYIHESNSGALAIARTIADRLESYPVLDEDDWSALEYDEAARHWRTLSVSDRVALCQRFRCNVFSARRADLPDCDSGELVPYLADGC